MIWSRKDTASGSSDGSHWETEHSTNENDASEQDVELLHAQLGSDIINESMHLAESKNSQGLQKQTIQSEANIQARTYKHGYQRSL